MEVFNVTVNLLEGMKIAHKDDLSKEFILIKSSKDNELYALYNNVILKINDLKDDLNNYICVNVSSFEEEVKVIETEKNKLYLMDNDFCIYSFIENEIDESETDFQSIDIRILRMTREEFMKRKGENYYLKCRDVISDEYEKNKIN